jgi:NitT/TauT family transport system permease protein
MFNPRILSPIPAKQQMILMLSTIVILLTLCQLFHNELLPSPSSVFNAVFKIVSTSGFYRDLWTSTVLIFASMGISIVISMLLVYTKYIPVLSPLSKIVSTFRFASQVGLVFVLTILVRDGHSIKTYMIVCGIVPYFVTTLLSYINEIPVSEFKLVTTLKMTRWQALYEVVILGRAHLLLETVRQNFAYGWSMIVAVENTALSEGGIGTLLIKSNRHMLIDEIFGVLLVIILCGAIFDYIFGLLSVYLFPYTNVKRYSKLWLTRK